MSPATAQLKPHQLDEFDSVTTRSFAEVKKPPESAIKRPRRMSHNVIDEEYTPSATNYPFVSCKSYVVLDADRNKSLHSKSDDHIREMASLTKIMTCLCSLLLARELNLNPNKTFFTVSKDCAGCTGTTAYLVTDQRIKLNDLLYGLMLPSGNDAALVLAENFGRLMRQLKRTNGNKKTVRDNQGNLERQTDYGGKYIDTFVKEMNRVAKNVVHLRKTQYANPHGLAERANHSTAFDQAILAAYAMKIP